MQVAAKKTYGEKLLDPRWQRKRLGIFERDDWKCTSCGATERTLQVHHRRYVPGGEPWDVPDADLTTLCDRCHEWESKERQHTDRWLLERIQDGAVGLQAQKLARAVALIPPSRFADWIFLTAVFAELVDQDREEEIGQILDQATILGGNPGRVRDEGAVRRLVERASNA